MTDPGGSAISATSATGLDHPVVGIGASAGGLEALKQFFTAVPADSGMAFVLVQHLDPTHESLMADLLAKYTKMPVTQVVDGREVEPNSVYVIPPNHYLTLRDGSLRLSPPTERRGMRMPIDHFLRSLAESLGEKAICVILSGTGSDGTLGLREVKAHGGMTVVQEPSTAQYNGMPASALATGLVDCCLPVEAMPEALLRYASHPYVRGTGTAERKAADSGDQLTAAIALIRSRTGHDFRHYKKGTLGRRITRRMSLATVESMGEYLKFLRSSDEEVHKLVRDLLIGVTSFFREPQAFETLISHIVPALVERARPDEAIRVWVPGCASGEEAYSLAIIFLQAIRQSGKQIGLQLFATDIDSEALEFARNGVYPVSAVSELPPEYVHNYFSRNGDCVSVNKSVREVVVFAAQNLISDPPFSRLDLISCRNLLIYLDSEVQARVIRLFHFALRNDGYLFLGNSETIGQRSDLFSTIAKKWRIYKRLNIPPDARGQDYYPVVSDATAVHARGATGRGHAAVGRRQGERVEQKLLEAYAPAAVLVDRSGEALYFHGATADYLEVPTGSATHEVVALAREGIRTALRATLQKAWREKQPMEARRLKLLAAGNERRIRIKVWPVDDADGTMLVCFESDDTEVGPENQIKTGDEALVKQLEYELKATREDLQTTIEEVETANEELKAANEEVMSMNEELQSTNEELETSKEELQSLNEELSTVNNQLLDKVHELESANNDLSNLLASTEIATIFLDTDLRVRRYTPPATRMFALIESDLGRPIGDITQRFSNGKLSDECHRVMSELRPLQEEVQRDDGACFQLRILPYRTLDNRIDGVVITFADITEIKTAYAEAQSRERQLKVITDALPALIAYVDREHRFLFVNAAYERWFEVPEAKILGEPLCAVFGTMAYDTLCPGLESAAKGTVAESTAVLDHRRLGERSVNVTWVPERDVDGAVNGFYSLIQDVTEQRRIERRLIAADVVFRSTTEAAAILDEQGRLTAVNPSFETVTGYASGKCIGKSWEFLLAERGVDDAPWHDLVKEGGWRGEVSLRRSSGEVFAAWMSIDVVTPGDGNVRGYVAVFADISSVKEAEKRLEYLAHHDPLSGLANRLMFAERLSGVLIRAGRQKRTVALLYLDLDGFKHVNDSFGHEVGDLVLQRTAERLRSCIRSEDLLARLGGDEFGLLLEEVTDPLSAASVAEKIIDSLREPFTIEGRELVLGVSIGVSLFPSDGTDGTVLIRNADTAMYRAKERGGNVVHFYTPALTEAVQRRVSTETALRRALDNNELELYFQPIQEIASRQIVGAEALLRWRAGARGLLLPESFLPIAELSGLIIQVGSRVLELACKQLAQWRKAELPVPMLSINVSARQCIDEGFVESLREVLNSHAIPTKVIDLEITESCFLDNASSSDILPALQRLGVRMTIDDFGTGYATLSSLRNAPISAIKIDRAFIDDIGSKKSDGAIARAVVALGHSQGLRVVAEGVESKKQLKFLGEIGCDACQGYLVAPPMSADEFEAWLQENRARVASA